MALTLHTAPGTSVELGCSWGAVDGEPESPHPPSEAPESLCCPPGALPAAPGSMWGNTHPGCQHSAHGPPSWRHKHPKAPGADLAWKHTLPTAEAATGDSEIHRPGPRFREEKCLAASKKAQRPPLSPAKAIRTHLERAGPARLTRPPSDVRFSVSTGVATGQRREDDPFQSAGEGQRSPGSARLLVDLFTRSLWPGSSARECWNRPAVPPPPPES